MSDRTRNISIVLIVVVTCALITLLSGYSARNASNASQATSDIARTLAKRSPITQFDAAVALHNDCRKDIEDHFLGAIGGATNPDVTQADRVASARAAQGFTAQLNDIDHVCPEPLPAVISPDGKVMAEPMIPEQYLCVIERRPCGP